MKKSLEKEKAFLEESEEEMKETEEHSTEDDFWKEEGLGEEEVE